MSGRIPRKRAGHGDPKFCSCAACKALMKGKSEEKQAMPDDISKALASSPKALASSPKGPFPEAKLHGTLEFAARGFHGFYNLAGEWISTNQGKAV